MDKTDAGWQVLPLMYRWLAPELELQMHPLFTCQMFLRSLNFDGVDGTKLRSTVRCRVPTE